MLSVTEARFVDESDVRPHVRHHFRERRRDTRRDSSAH